MWKYCVSVRTLRYRGPASARLCLPVAWRARQPGRQAGRFAVTLRGPGQRPTGDQGRRAERSCLVPPAALRVPSREGVCGHLAGTRSAHWRVPGAGTVWPADSQVCTGTRVCYAARRPGAQRVAPAPSLSEPVPHQRHGARSSLQRTVPTGRRARWPRSQPGPRRQAAQVQTWPWRLPRRQAASSLWPKLPPADPVGAARGEMGRRGKSRAWRSASPAQPSGVITPLWLPYPPQPDGRGGAAVRVRGGRGGASLHRRRHPAQAAGSWVPAT